MSAIEERTQANVLPFGVRPMEELDLSQLTEIERDAFPTLFPPTSFRRELRNRLAHYLVAWRRGDGERDAAPENGPEQGPDGRPLFARLLSNAKCLVLAWASQVRVNEKNPLPRPGESDSEIAAYSAPVKAGCFESHHRRAGGPRE